ncbi:hypothetical protein DL765_002147 [Monosporascus sp. GIB2]|nr:hypothetical protein DL765_002147 [Monosporascus sp. GIB2]
MKNLKISGLSAASSDFVQRLRVEELAAGSRFRKIGIIAAIFGYIPLMVSQPLTFAFAQRELDAARMFTSLAYLLLLTNPLSVIFQSIPQLLPALASFGRIQAFFECETRHDFREVLADMRRNSEKARADTVASPDPELDLAHPVVIRNGKFGWEADKFALRTVDTRVSKSPLTIVVGPVGSGKSTLCKALLGEIPFSEGSAVLSTRFPHVGFCDQTAFLSNGSVRDNIGDRTNVGSDGITLSGGQKQRVSLGRALYLQSNLLVLDDIFSGLDADTEEQVFRRVFGPDGLLRRRRSTVVLCTHSVRHLPAADYIIALGDGTIVEQGSFDKLMTRQGNIKKSARESKPQLLHATTTNTSSLAPHTDESCQVGDKTAYKHYFKSMVLLLAGCSLFFAALWGFVTNVPTIWLEYWSHDVSSEQPAHTYAYYAGIYALLQICGLISLNLLAIAIFIVSVKRAGANLHRGALRTLIRAPLRFFTATDTGVVTNLFSQDLNLIDTELPNALLNTLFCVTIGQAAVMLTSSPYMAISYPFLGALLYMLQRFYLRTSRQLRLLDLETKSPLYTQYLDTLENITKLRAFGFLPHYIQKNVRLLKTSQRPAYLLVMIQQWLNLVLDLVVMVMAAVLTALAVRLHSNTGFTDASLVTLMNFGENLSGIVIFYTRLETSIGAIARLKAFSENVKPEDRDEEDIVPPEQWPQSGVVELKANAPSSAEDQSNCTPNLALRDIDLMINSGEKVAICGRTGSGKSSVIALLLKLLDPLAETAGNAVIDNAPLHRIDRPALRQRIIAVPQEAVFLPDGSTFRANLDPFDASTPEECQAVLAVMGLRQFVQERGGLGSGMSTGTLSAGQRQLMSLGRALLRRHIRARNLGIGGGGSEDSILLLDKMSSTVNHETERVMQDILRAEFMDYTVSHRPDMIMDFDRVVVMDTGEIVEFGNPRALAGEEGTRFGELVRAGAK